VPFAIVLNDPNLTEKVGSTFSPAIYVTSSCCLK